MDQLLKKAQEAVHQVNQIILGKEDKVRETFLTFLANGHVLLEDIPGVGKTTLALAFSRALKLDCHRIQFTPDVMPSDLTGFSVYQKETGKFVYQPGSVFCNLLLADEINRTSPKTQSALLEVMEEGQVSVEGITRAVPQPFLVIATQNPSGSTGTQFLPEAQVDRFMVTMSMGYPDFEHEVSMAMSVGDVDWMQKVDPIIEPEDLLEMQHKIHTVYMKENLYQYLVELVAATRNSSYLEQGASPRATISLVRMAKASAWFKGKDYVTPAEVAEQFPYVISHRIIRNTSARMEGISKEKIIQEVIRSVKKPPLGEVAG